MTRKEVEVYAVAGAIAEETLASIRTVVAFGGQKSEFERYTTNLQKTYRNNIKKGLLAGLGFGLVWLFIYASYALSFWYGVTLILDDRNLAPKEQTYTAATMVTVCKHLFLFYIIKNKNIKIHFFKYKNVFFVNKGLLQRYDGKHKHGSCFSIH